MFTPEQIKNLQKASTDFVFFVNNIFSLSEKVFTGGEYVDDTARFLSQNRKTIRVSARNHFKSFSIYAHFMWKLLFEGATNPIEAHYMSFNQDLAGYHVNKIRQAIQKNPYYDGLRDMKPTAETTLRYTWDNKNYTTLSPHGLIQFKRGIHADIIYVDDPFQDPENEMNPVVIRKINEVFKSNILDMPKEPDGELHVVGCLSPESIILLGTGNYKKLKDITINDKIIGYDFNEKKFKPKKILNLIDNGIQEVIKIETKFGKETILTLNHPVYTNDGWKEASKLKEQDFIATPRKIITENNKNNISEYEAELIGYILAEGNIGKRGGFALSNTNPYIIDRIKYLADNSNLIFRKKLDNRKKNKKYKDNYGIWLGIGSGKNKNNIKERLNLKYQKCKTKTIPDCIFTGSKTVIASFLKGIYEGDGSYNKIRHDVEFGSCSKNLAVGVYYLLLQLGLPSQFGVKRKISGFSQREVIVHSVSIRGNEEVNQFLKLTNSFQYKNPQIKNCKKHGSNGDVIPLSEGEKELAKKLYGFHSLNAASYKKLKEFKEFNYLTKNNIYWDKIKKITYLDKQKTLNLTVEGGNFVSDGILTHNTAQTNDDFYFDKIITRRFNVRIQPAIKNDGTALWPEWMDIDELNLKREERTDRIFKREYMCQPVLSTKAFFNKEKIVENIVNKDLSNLNIKVKQRHSSSLVIAGFDIGKKTHPSHLSVFQLVNNRLIMLHHRFMDGWSYSNGKQFYDSAPTQLEYLKLAIENFGIHELYYDNTRGEFESFVEQGLLPRQMIPVIFTAKLKNTSATSFDRLVEKKQMEIVNDDRLISQICAVTGDLQAASTPQGHGDCYDDQTEVLTESGWKFFKDVSYADKIATLKNQKYLEYQKPTNIINEKYTGKMYEIATTQVNLVVTPRHKLFVNYYPQRKIKNYELLNPCEIEGRQVTYKKDADWIGKEQEYFEFENIKIKMDDFLKFVGYYVSKGYTYRDKAIIICQKEGWKSNQMYNDLKKLPFNVKQKHKKISDKYGYDGSIYFFSTVLTKWAKEYLGTPSINKKLPEWILSLSSKQLRILLDALVLGDGTYCWWPGIKGTASSYTTISKKLANQIQEIALKIGWSANINFSDNNIDREGMFGTGNHRVYTITFIINKNQPSVHKHKKSDRWINYTGNIYCVTVPNHIIYVRRNGKPVWSGNSYWSIALVAKGVIDRIGYSDSDFSSPIRQKVATGSKSLFTEGAAIPRNW